ncbi:MAG TPA: hypothetical protein PKK10_17180 [Woeseiaceae bacterium]|nr:hypothetical protein [Woeseiaceae bacterium]
MSSYMPFIVIALALLAAGSIAFVAWEVLTKDVQDALEKALGQPANGAADTQPDHLPGEQQPESGLKSGQEPG